jgi:hypothetical protein
MTGHGAKFGRKMEEAITALRTHRTIEEAAVAVKVCAKTLRRWMRVPEFQAAYRQVGRDAVMLTNARIQQNSGAAASVQFKLMADLATPASVRASTSRYILESANKSVEKESWEDFDVRLAALESAHHPEPPVSRRKPKAV